MASRKGKGGRQYVLLWRNVKRSAAYHGLSLAARATLIELMDRYNGSNNGFIGLGVRELSYELHCSKDTAGRALRELDDAKLAQPTKVGKWRGQKATEWRLVFEVCHKTGDLPTKSFDQRPTLSQSDQRDAKVRPEGRKPISSPTRGTRNEISSIERSSSSPTRGTHIHIYQEVSERCGAHNATDTGFLIGEGKDLEREQNGWDEKIVKFNSSVCKKGRSK
jgi:hypothetical protein